MSFFIINNFYYEKYSPSLEYLPYISISLVFQSVMMIYLNVFYYIEKKKFVSKFIFSTSIIQAVCGLFSMEFIGIYGLLVFNIVFNFIVLMYILGKFHKELNAIKYATP